MISHNRRQPNLQQTPPWAKPGESRARACTTLLSASDAELVVRAALSLVRDGPLEVRDRVVA